VRQSLQFVGYSSPTLDLRATRGTALHMRGQGGNAKPLLAVDEKLEFIR
jgi:hypothetical protein